LCQVAFDGRINVAEENPFIFYFMFLVMDIATEDNQANRGTKLSKGLDPTPLILGARNGCAWNLKKISNLAVQNA
jgi:hypothetical protein